MPTITTDESRNTILAIGAATAAANTSRAAEAAAVDELIGQIKSTDDSVRGPAWQGAGRYGAPTVKALAALMSDEDFETARSAKRALWLIVRHAGRPGAAKESRAVTKELIPLLGGNPSAVRREVLWMLSEIAGDDAVAPMAALLTDKEVRDDALCALMRLPGRKARSAMASAFRNAPEEFKFALAEALRNRGEKVKGFPSQKLVPTRQTTVTQPQPA